MSLDRHDWTEVHALLDHPHGLRSGLRRLEDAWNESLRELESAHTTRTWDAIHILLTGCENDKDARVPLGPAPARDVVMGGLVLSDGTSRLNVPILLRPAEVRAVDAHLRGIDLDALIRERYPLLLEIGPYSFDFGDEGDMVTNGLLAADFAVLRAFYARAAAAGNAVIKFIF
ncbi:DUF1877 family protein [Actinomadura sp. LD22]|uniref:DUF1877 family protein n=1 Tax=Actinomadura physcomitrii TaxID=2650748 RepID=A0A6I4ME90_9ACTN|nr:DUF1877 family protein [Actinomadura physcomitrii]MWA04042.1 DUF1877 family protein [Actinomadura physcomitrii]